MGIYTPCQRRKVASVRKLLLIIVLASLSGCGGKGPISNAFVEQEIRNQINKPKGTLTKADLEKVETLRRTRINDRNLIEVAQLTQLKDLSLEGNPVTAKGLKPIVAFKQLTSLDLSSTKMHYPAALKEVAKLKQLTHLKLSFTPVTDEGLAEVAKLQRLKLLTLFGCKMITDEGLKEVAKLQRLNSLVLEGTEITDKGLKEVAKLKLVNFLNLRNTKTTEAGVAELQKALPNCRIYRVAIR